MLPEVLSSFFFPEIMMSNFDSLVVKGKQCRLDLKTALTHVCFQSWLYPFFFENNTVDPDQLAS